MPTKKRIAIGTRKRISDSELIVGRIVGMWQAELLQFLSKIPPLLISLPENTPTIVPTNIPAINNQEENFIFQLSSLLLSTIVNAFNMDKFSIKDITLRKLLSTTINQEKYIFHDKICKIRHSIVSLLDIIILNYLVSQNMINLIRSIFNVLTPLINI